MNNILQQICSKRHEDVLRLRKERPLPGLLADIKSHAPVRGFAKALKDKAASKEIGLIAEIKRASPSEGEIRPDFDPAACANAYEQGGATCLSVLTEPHRFKGDDAYIQQAKQSTSLPVLRKDFIVDPYQVIESRHIGADCILLIMAALSDSQARELYDTAREVELDVLVEIHDESDRDRALALGLIETGLLGINNRNLKTLEIDLYTSYRLSRDLPPDLTLVSESGIHTPQDIEKLIGHGIHCFLVGTSLMKQRNLETATRNLLTIR